jgi:uncharacterized protein (TIGR02444 family)
MSTAGPVPFRRFALAVYRRPGVSEACLLLQDRACVDVNVVLLGAYAGAVMRVEVTADALQPIVEGVAAWHREVVIALRTVRRRLKTGPPPAPDGATARLRHGVKRLELDAELVELDALAELSTQLAGRRTRLDAEQAAAAAVGVVVGFYGEGRLPDDEQRTAIATIAAAAAGTSA